MQFHLSDFQIIGAEFTPTRIFKKTKKYVEMNGHLHLRNYTYHVKISIRNNVGVKIIRICGSTPANAISDCKQLKEIHKNALRNNENGLAFHVYQRRVKIVAWLILSALYLLCMLYTLKMTIWTMPSLLHFVVLITCITLLSICLIYRNQIIYGKHKILKGDM